MNIRRRALLKSDKGEKLEFIITDKQQYIDTDWIPKLHPKVEWNFYQKNPVYQDGLENTFQHTDTNDTLYVFTFNHGGGGGEFPMAYFWNDLNWGSGGVIHRNSLAYCYVTTPHKLTMTDTYVECLTGYQNNVWYVKFNTETRSGYSGGKMTLFGALGNAFNRSDLVIYGIKCWNDDVLERDFIPYRQNGRAGLYDTIHHKFWPSSSGVDFIGSDEVSSTSLEEEIIDNTEQDENISTE